MFFINDLLPDGEIPIVVAKDNCFGVNQQLGHFYVNDGGNFSFRFYIADLTANQLSKLASKGQELNTKLHLACRLASVADYINSCGCESEGRQAALDVLSREWIKPRI